MQRHRSRLRDLRYRLAQPRGHLHRVGVSPDHVQPVPKRRAHLRDFDAHDPRRVALRTSGHGAASVAPELAPAAAIAMVGGRRARKTRNGLGSSVSGLTQSTLRHGCAPRAVARPRLLKSRPALGQEGIDTFAELVTAEGDGLCNGLLLEELLHARRFNRIISLARRLPIAQGNVCNRPRSGSAPSLE